MTSSRTPEQAARQSRRDREWWARVSAEWLDFAHAQYLAASARCNGHLLSARGSAEIRAEFPALWTGAESTARERASEELRAFWDDPRPGFARMTVSEYARSQYGRERDRYDNERAAGYYA